MEIYNHPDLLPYKQQYIATIGFFDGLHAGHRFLIAELKKLATKRGMKSMIITFREHPRNILQNSYRQPLLTTNDEKINLLATTGIDVCVILDFTLEMSLLSAEQFIRDILFARYNVRSLLIGYDHRFGHNREEGFADYVRYGQSIGIEVIEATKYILPGAHHISSSLIRKNVFQGNVSEAALMLGYRYRVKGVVVKGQQNGRKLGFPTANIQPLNRDKLIPEGGVYAVKVSLAERQFNGMLNIGTRPTLNNGENKTIEVNIFDFEEDIYDYEIEVQFVERIRDEQKFNSLASLTTQLAADKAIVSHILQEKQTS
jgi:riboflavin kinase/FMN adenylyltransferase